MAEAEYLLPLRQRNSESALSASANGEERTPSPPPAEKPTSPSVCIQPPSPGLALNRNGHHLLKNSTVPANKSKAVRKKKKRLSDIFAHIVGGSKDSAVSNAAGQIHAKTSALNEEPTDSPYADLDSVPMLNRPKRTAVSPVCDVDRKEQRSGKIKKSTKKPSQSSSSVSPKAPAKKSTPKNVNAEQSLAVRVETSHGFNENHSDILSANNLETAKPPRTEEGTDLGSTPAPSHASADAPSSDHFDLAPTEAAIKAESSPVWESLSSTLSFVNAPKRRPRKLEKKQTHNGLMAKPKRKDSAVFQPVRIKTENVASAVSATSPSLSPADTFQDCKELSFSSLAKEDSDSEQAAFRPDSSYKFSTFLMLLKDMHDTREREGKVLVLPPPADLIKEEPLVIPTSAQNDPPKGSCEALESRLKTGPSGRGSVTQSTPVKIWTKAVQAAGAGHREDAPLRSESSDKQRRKQKLPAKLKVRDPSGPMDPAHGREFISSRTGSAEPGSAFHLDPSNSCLERTPETAVAPKKRWQVLEEAAEIKEEVVSETSAEMKETFSARTSPEFDLRAEKHTENDSQSSDTSSAAGNRLIFIFLL